MGKGVVFETSLTIFYTIYIFLQRLTVTTQSSMTSSAFVILWRQFILHFRVHSKYYIFKTFLIAYKNLLKQEVRPIKELKSITLSSCWQPSTHWFIGLSSADPRFGPQRTVTLRLHEQTRVSSSFSFSFLLPSLHQMATKTHGTPPTDGLLIVLL